jgi:hypothetical protein
MRSSDNKVTQGDEIIVQIYDAIEVLEYRDDKNWNKALLLACRYPEYFWEPLGERLSQLYTSMIFKAGEQNTQEEKKKKARHYRAFVNLRRALVLLLHKQPQEKGVALVIRYLVEHIPEALAFLK